MINGLHELTNDQRHTLDALDLLLGTYQLALQAPTPRTSALVELGGEGDGRRIPLLILDVLFLQLDVLELARQLLEIGILVGAVGRCALKVLDAGNGGWDALLELGVADWALDQDVPHLDGRKMEARMSVCFPAGRTGALSESWAGGWELGRGLR